MTRQDAPGRFQPRPNLRRERRRRGWSENDTATRLYNLGIEHGVSEDQLGVDARAVSRWELGRTQPNQTYTALLSRLYELPPGQLDLPPLVLPVETGELATAQFAAVDSVPVKRRDFIKLGGLGVAAVAQGIDAERLAAVLAGIGVDERAIDGVESLTRNLMRLEATTAPQSLLPAVAGHLGAFRDLFFRTPVRLLARTYSLAGETALLAGYLALKLERRELADQYWKDADRFAEIAGDVNLQAALVVCRAYRHNAGFGKRDERVVQAVRFFERAGSLLGRRPEPAAAALFYSYRAVCLAKTACAESGRADAAMRDLDAAQRHLSRMDGVGTSLYVVEDVRGDTAHVTGVTLLYLDRPQEAAAQFGELLSSLDAPSPSWRSGITAHLGAAHARLGAVEQACDALGRAHVLAVEAGSPYRVRNVRVISQEYLAGIDAPAVRRLAEEIGT